MAERVTIEKAPGIGYLARLERESGAVYSMSDGGSAASLESFLPKAAEWAKEIGCVSVTFEALSGE